MKLRPRSLRGKLVGSFLALTIVASVGLIVVFYYNQNLSRVADENALASEFELDVEQYLQRTQQMANSLFAIAANVPGYGRSSLLEAKTSLALLDVHLAQHEWHEGVIARADFEPLFALRRQLSAHAEKTVGEIEALSQLKDRGETAELGTRRRALHLALTQAAVLAERAGLHARRIDEKVRASHARRADRGKQLARNNATVSLAMILAILVMALLLSWRLARSIVWRLHALNRTAKRFGRGDMHSRAHVVGDDEIAVLAGTFNRMVEDLQKHTGLRLSKQFVENILHAMLNGLLVVDAGGRIERTNTAALRLLGYTESELVGRHVRNLWTGPPDTHVYQQFIAGTPVSGRETQLVTRAGEVCSVAIFSAPMQGEQNNQKYVWVIEDIAERQKLFGELQSAKQAAERATAAKSRFLANMSHELRTPLNSILGFAQILLDDPTITDQQRTSLRTMHASGEHLLVLLDDILDISRIEAGRLDVRMAEFRLPTLLDSMVAMFTMQAENSGLHFLYEPLSPLPAVVHGDQRRLRQLLINLLGNAVKYTREGGVVLRVGQRQGMWRFEVIDSGIGISEADIHRIFEPFHQGAEKVHAGAGLGLAICRRLVELMGGEMGVRSTPGGGSTFWFQLALPEIAPMDVDDAVVAAPNRRIVGYQGSRRKVLIVDDKDQNRAVLRELLTPLGFEICEAEDGRGAIDTAVWERPDMVLMDIKMPNLDGLQATRQLRGIPAFENVPILAVSASAFDDDRQEAESAGCDGFLAKPVRRDELLSQLGTHLSLTWLHEAVPESISQRYLTGATAPPADDLRALLDLARRGDIKGIRQRADELAAREPDCAPVADTLHRLGKRYRIKKIREYLGTFE